MKEFYVDGKGFSFSSTRIFETPKLKFNELDKNSLFSLTCFDRMSLIIFFINEFNAIQFILQFTLRLAGLMLSRGNIPPLVPIYITFCSLENTILKQK